MYCNKITYTDYRNLESVVFEPSKGVNMLQGSNAQGKTNILEGIYYFAQGHGLKGNSDRELVRFGQEGAKIEIVFTDKTRTRHHEIEFFSAKRKICKKEGLPVSGIREFIGIFKVVCFTPDHLSIIKDSPFERRNFIDKAISQIYPAYLLSLIRYNKILLQRNAVLKDPSSLSFKEIIEALSIQLAKEGAFISTHRCKYVNSLDAHVRKIINKMTNGAEDVKIKYKEPCSSDEYLDLLTKNIVKEVKIGSTAYGIHKDDLLITLNGVDTRSFASQGQQRSIAFALKLAEGEISNEICAEYPVFLFDDVLSELDTERKNFILNELSGKQVIISGCEPIASNAKTFIVSKGTLQ